MGESKNGFVISDYMDSASLPKNEIYEKGSFTTTTAWPRAPSDEENRGKKNKLILAGKTRRKNNISYV